MMKLIGVARLGKDAELRHTSAGKAVVNMSLAWNYGRPDESGKRPSQWVEVAFFGDRAEKVHPYLKKGTSLFLDVQDMHVETYAKKDGGTGVKLVGTVFEIDFAGDRPKQDESKKKFDESGDVPF